MPTRLCPDCESELSPLEESTAANCSACHGVWIPSDQIPPGGAALFQAMMGGLRSVPSQRAFTTCPDCGIQTLELLGSQSFRIRRCRGCNGLWLNASTLARLRREITPRWRGFLEDVLGKGLAGVLRG